MRLADHPCLVLPCLGVQDAKARATRSAMLVEYAHRNDFLDVRESRLLQNERHYDDVLSA